MQKLNGMLTSLNKFISKYAQNALRFYKLLRKKIDFEWTTDCKEAFEYLNKTLAIPLVLTWPLPREILYLYPTIAEEAISIILIRGFEANQSHVYFISEPPVRADTWFQKIKKRHIRH